jgi:hypothetical protein
VTFGSVPVGTTTPYKKVSRGVYGYGSYQFTVDGATVEQPVIDWVGERPREGKDFTYRLKINALPNNQYFIELQLLRDR